MRPRQIVGLLAIVLIGVVGESAAQSGTITTVAGTGTFGYNGDGMLATSAQLFSPTGITLDVDGNLFIVDTGNHRIRRVQVAAEALLSDLVISLNLQKGISNAFDAKLDVAVNALEDANENIDVVAINGMYAFMNQVEGQRGNELTDAEADLLIAAAQAIISALGD